MMCTGFLASDASGPPGAELRAMFGRQTHRKSDWVKLRAALGGIFCTSLSTIDDSTTLHRPSSESTIFAGETVSFLWREMLCTENLVPVIKLLPCREHAGLSAYMRPAITAAADFMSLSVRVKRTNGAHGITLSMNILINLVLPSSASTVADLPMASFHISRDLLGDEPGSPLPPACPWTTSSILRLSSPSWGALYSDTRKAEGGVVLCLLTQIAKTTSKE